MLTNKLPFHFSTPFPLYPNSSVPVASPVILTTTTTTKKQQQIHAQQIPGAPQQPVPSLGPLNLPLSFGGPMGGLPHGHPGMLKMAQEQQQQLHGRGVDDMKMGGVGGGGPSVEDRLVRLEISFCLILVLIYPFFIV